jgi:ABC-type nitrate/sulfonate/bicarbonate transport system permease component
LSVVGAFAFFVLAWQAVVLVGGLPPYILPPPEMVAERFVGLARMARSGRTS